MADLGSKSALKTSIDGKIFTNTTFEVSAEDIRSSFEDTIDTLCGKVEIMASYADLATLVGSSSLEPGTIYIFPYETVSLVGSVSTPTLNTSVPGYTAITEQLAIVAKNNNSFFGSARSLNHPKDIIVYDFTDDTESTTATSRSGFIKYRRDVDRNIEAFFDFRNNYVARYGLSKVGVEVTTPVAKSKGDIIYYNVTGSTVSAGWYFVNSTTTNIVSSAEANADTLSAITQIDEDMYGDVSVQMADTIIAHDGSSIAYHQSIDALSKNVIIQKDTTDVLLVNSSGVFIGQSVSKTTINASSDVKIGASSSKAIVKSSTAVVINGSCENIYGFSITSNNFGYLVRHYLGISADDVEVGANSERIVSISNSSNNEVGCDSSAIYFVRDASYNVLGKNNANITVFKGSNNSFKSNCSSIQIYGGSNNRFAQSCTLINMLGDRDEALGFGTSYVSPYSKMDNNTFGTSCEDISFENVGGRGNTFGDECAHLTFVDTASNSWRLVGCDFVRGIRNKTFESVLHGASFIVPNQTLATITEDDWYVPQLFVGTLNPDQAGGSVLTNDGKRLTSSASQTNNNTNQIAIGYQRTGSFFDTSAGGSGAQRANGGGTAAGNTDAEYRLFGPPTNKAFQWTHDGYPLLINFISNNVTGSDPTVDLNT